MTAADPRLLLVAVRLTIPKEEGRLWIESIAAGVAIGFIAVVAEAKITETRRMYHRLKGDLAK